MIKSLQAESYLGRQPAKIRWWPWVLSSLILSLYLVLAGVLSVLAAEPFIKHTGQLNMGGQRFVTDSWVIKDGDTYKMWFTHPGTEITPSQVVGLISGLDLNTILTALKNRDLAALLDHLSGLDPDTVYDLVRDTASVIGYATSSDGINWTIANTQVLAATLELQNVAAPCVIKVSDTSYHVWYTRNTTSLSRSELSQILTDLNGTSEARKTAVLTLIENGKTIIEHATSPDGINWTVQAGAVISGDDSFLGNSVAAPCVIQVTGGYQMWFSNVSTGIAVTDIDDLLASVGSVTIQELWQLQAGVNAGIGYATSTDGINWTVVGRDVFSGSSGVLNAVATPCVILDGSAYQMWYTYGVTDFTEADIAPILDEIGVIDITSLLALLEAENYGALITELTQIIANEIPETKSRLSGTTTKIGYATSTNGVTWSIENPDALIGTALTPWSGVGRPCVIQTGQVYQIWYTKGIDELTADNLVALWQGSIPTIGYASSSALVAETTSNLMVDGDGVVVSNMVISSIKDVNTGDPVTLPGGGITGYHASVTADPAGVELVTVRGVAPFSPPYVDIGTREFYYENASPVQPADTVTARAVLRLVGDCLTPYGVTLAYDSILAAEPPGLSIPEEQSYTYTFLRGDANDDGKVNITDAMFIAQNITDPINRPLSDLNIINAASVRYDGIVGDTITINDAMFIAQKVTGARDANFQLVN